MVCSERMPDTTTRASSMAQRRYSRLLPVLMAATPSPTAANSIHQPSRVGRMVRRGWKRRRHCPGGRAGPAILAGDGDVLDDGTDHVLGPDPRRALVALHD